MSLEESISGETDRSPRAFELYDEAIHELYHPHEDHHTRGFERGDAPSPSRPPGTEADGDDINFQPVTSEYMMGKKYQRRYFIPHMYGYDIPIVRALQTDFRRIEPPTSHSCMNEFTWKSYEAPEGNLYFRDERKRITTFVDLFNPSFNIAVSKCARNLLRKISEFGRAMPEDCEMVIIVEDYEDGGGYGYGYYLVSWEKRCLFWLEDVSYEFLTQYSRVCITESHIGKQLESLFWLHIEMFPNHYDAPQDVLDDLKNTLNYGIHDHLTSVNSIFPYTKTEAVETIECLSKVDVLKRDANGTMMVAQCAQRLAKHKFLNYHGERGARIHAEDSIKRASLHRSRSLFFVAVSSFFFKLPNTYMEKIEKIWVDETVDSVAAKQLMRLFEESWQDSIIPATVILSTNVGFLAIASIDTNRPNRNAAQMAAYISSVLALSNIITIHILKIKGSLSHLSSTEIIIILKRMDCQWLGSEWIAILCSLPTVLMIWSMISFLVALMVVFFSNTSTTTRAVMASVTAFLGFITWLTMWRHPFDITSTTSTRFEDLYEHQEGATISSALRCGLRSLKHRLTIRRPHWSVFKQHKPSQQLATFSLGSLRVASDINVIEVGSE